jgi:hypothetical protein
MGDLHRPDDRRPESVEAQIEGKQIMTACEERITNLERCLSDALVIIVAMIGETRRPSTRDWSVPSKTWNDFLNDLSAIDHRLEGAAHLGFDPGVVQGDMVQTAYIGVQKEGNGI